ncbi:hypothetical protein [Couchioplanes caeruleus]|uniref:Uncharacterized protein n=1 Tax=Couchioplanes caeruleus TaxID=56438 RepID=A0A3N1GEW2_9ACTN|nr:hypothetical protein [Couchioplanes caeruleus]ROP28862.1 hypothetical protein EDD30_1640 [Couchioplanes caeruleus]
MNRYSGLWALFTGGAVLALLLVILQPATTPAECPNYGAAGNASPFKDAAWDMWFPLLALGWVVLVLIEQVLPRTRRHRGGASGAARAAGVVMASVAGSCCLVGPFLVMCR